MTAVELRVHGVGGSTPEQLLNTGPATRVAGDADAGFYVATDPDLEGYCWGNLTSGAATRSMWLLMLPFTLVNASFWMGPVRKANEALVRLLALSLTATTILSAEGLGPDLLGWQCAAMPTCRDRHSWLSWLGHGWVATPARRIVVAGLVPLSVLVLLWVLARRTARYERAEPHAPGGTAPLEEASFWYGARQVDRLRELHVSVGLAVMCIGLAVPLYSLDSHPHRDLRALDWIGGALAWGVIVVASLGVCLTQVVKRDLATAPGTHWPKGLQRFTGGLLVAMVALALVPDRTGAVAVPGHGNPGYAPAVATVFLGQLVGVALLALTVLRHRDRRAAVQGMAQPVFASLGLLVASVFTAGLAFRGADYLDGSGSLSDSTLTVPIAYAWAAVSLFVVAIPTAVLLVITVLGRLRRTAAADRLKVRADYEQPEHLDSRVNAIARTRAVASLTDPALVWISCITAVSLVAAVVSMVLTLAVDDSPVQSVTEGTGRDLLRFGLLWGTWLVSGFAFGLLVVGYRSYRGASLRKHLGIIWDLGTFWPRAAHPLAPPCYVERCLPDLVTRITYLVEERGGVVISAHSQGTVIAAALVWQLPRDVLDKVRLITYGSPVARLYGRVYSAWFGPDQIVELQKRIGEGRWTNFYRSTDWIGGRVGTSADHEILCDPPLLGERPGDAALEQPHGHFDYELTEEYRTELARLRADLDRPDVIELSVGDARVGG